MPLGRTKKHKISKKQKIAARLIEISLIVDNYIYNKQQISIEDAKQYADEVERYEPKCVGDARSLQVIEKLTRFMKTIIDEQCESDHNSNIVQLGHSFNNYHSSGYKIVKSLELEPQETQCQGEIHSNCDENKDETETTKINEESQGNCKDKIDKSNYLTDSIKEVDLDRTLSNLSISLIDPFQNALLTKFNSFSTPLETSNVIEDKCIRTTDAEKIVLSNESDSLAKHKQKENNINNLLPNNVHSITERSSNMTTTVTGSSTDCKLNELRDNQCELLPNIIQAEKSFSYKKVSLHIKKRDDLGISLQTKKTVGRGLVFDCTQINNMSIEEKENKNKHINQVKKQQPINKRGRKHKVTTSTTQSKLVTGKLKVPNMNSKKNILKKTKSKVNLSWVENIKHVRIIDPNEYDQVNLDDTFWNNCNILSNWSEDLFMADTRI